MRPDEGRDDRRLVQLDRRPDYHPVRWLLLSGSRRTITLLLSVLVLVTLLALGTILELEMERLVDETRAVQSLFNTLLGGIILFVSVVLSINIAALSQEFAPLRTKQLQIEETLEFQRELEQFVPSGVSPADLHGFVRFVLTALRTEAERLRTRSATVDDEAAREATLAFVDDLEANVAVVERRLGQAPRTMSSSLLAGLDWDAADHIHVARRLRSEHEATLEGPARSALSNLVEILTAFASGREYFTTLYFKRELRNLSSSLVVLSLPVIVFTAYVLLAIDAGLFPTLTVLGIEPRLLYISIAFVISLSPYVLLSAYMLRMVTVSKHSLGSGGFTLTAADRDERPSPTESADLARGPASDRRL